MEETKGLILNDHFFTTPELIQFCKAETAAQNQPTWKLDIYRFILDFLDDSETIVQKSSGTTGKQKVIHLPKKSMIASAKNTIGFFKLKESDVAVLCLPVQYIAGKMMVVRAMVAGMNLKIIEPAGTPDFSEIGKIDFCAMVPMQASNTLQQKKWPEIKALILGGAETGEELKRELQKWKTLVFETYGMAETCSHVALKKISGKQPESDFIALPGVQLTSDERDCLVIDAEYLPERIVTNDRVEIVKPNRFKWLGRYDNVINSGGIKIQPEILEKQFKEILQKPCAVIGKPDKLLGQKMVLVLEASGLKDEEIILSQLKSYFEKKFLPKSVYFLPSLPRNKSFKIDRIKLARLV